MCFNFYKFSYCEEKKYSTLPTANIKVELTVKFMFTGFTEILIFNF